MPERDPRVDPKPGDVFFKAGKRLHFLRTVRRVQLSEVLYQDGFGQVCASSAEAFERWAKTAEVIREARNA